MNTIFPYIYLTVGAISILYLIKYRHKALTVLYIDMMMINYWCMTNIKHPIQYNLFLLKRFLKRKFKWIS